MTARGVALPGSAENPAIALVAFLGAEESEKATLNEMTTVSSAYVSGRFLGNDGLSGNALGLSIISKNHGNLVDVKTGGYGQRIQDPLNSTQTSTMANLATLSSLLAGCVRQVQANSCDDLFSATTAPDGTIPENTLDAIRQLVRSKSYQTEAVFALLDTFFPVSEGKKLRDTPYLPYRSNAPTAWTLAIKFTGGGLSAPGKMMFDAEGNAWAGANFIVGAQASDELWDGNLAKFTSDGKPLSPDDGFRFDGVLGQMRGIIATPYGDIWELNFSKDRIVGFEGTNPEKGKLCCQGDDPKGDESTCRLEGPFFFAIDQQDRVSISNLMKNYVSRFPVDVPEAIEHFEVGYSPKGLAIDSKRNVWVSNTLGARIQF